MSVLLLVLCLALGVVTGYGRARRIRAAMLWPALVAIGLLLLGSSVWSVGSGWLLGAAIGYVVLAFVSQLLLADRNEAPRR